MGTRVAPTCANIYMRNFQEKMVFHKKNIRYWYRFIDDIWSIPTGAEEESIDFVDYLNRNEYNLKFMAQYSKGAIQFLDITTRKYNKTIITELYTKPTDSHSYLDFSSCHLLSMKMGIPKSQFICIRRNWTSWIDYVKPTLQLVFYFQLRGYPLKLIRESLLEVQGT